MRIAKTLLAAALLALAPTGGEAEEVAIPHGGLTLNGTLQSADGKGLAEGVVVLVHGTLAHRGMEIIATLQELLKERGVNTLAINLSLGVDKREGMYDCKILHTHSHFDAIAEIGAWMDWLKAKGAGKVSLLGHSRGGNQVAMMAAEHDRPELHKTILIGPGTRNLDEMSDAYKKRYGKALQPLMGKVLAKVKGGRGSEVLNDTDFLYCPKASVTARSFAGYYINDPRLDASHIVDWIDKPVLVVAGTEDTINPDVIAKFTPKAAAKANITLAVIEDAGHFFRDLFAEDLADAIAEFLEAS